MNHSGVNESLSGNAGPASRSGLAAAAQKLVARAAIIVLAPLLVAACASSSEVTQADGTSGRYTLHADAAGGSVAWARSHKAVMQSASDFCERRGQMMSVVSESSKGVRALEEHQTELTFECHARF